jgi:ankyrin repeat protein
MLSFLSNWRRQIQHLLWKRRQQLALCQAIYHGNLKRVQEIVDGGLDLNFERDGVSPLCRAVSGINEWTPDARKIIDYLMAHGASPRSPGNDFLLSIAARVGESDFIDLALAAGHDIHSKFENSTTPLQSAAFRNKAETMKYLIERGATKEDFDLTRCSWARISAPTILVLLDLGVDVPEEVVGYVKTGNW